MSDKPTVFVETYIRRAAEALLTQWQVDKVFTEAGFSFLWKGSFGNAMRHTAGSPRLRLVAELNSRVGPSSPNSVARSSSPVERRVT
jgi:hypothetical protein